MLLEVFACFIAIFCLLYFRISNHYSYWRKRRVAFIKPIFPLGTLHDHFLGKADAGTINQNWYNTYQKRQGLKYVGAFRALQPTLLMFDLDMCKRILTKDFYHFVNRDFTPNTHEYISKHLFALDGQDWRDMRVKLTPTFTSGKMKSMFLLMKKCAENLQEHIHSVVLNTGEFEVKDLIVRFTTDVIATCAFGLEVNSIEDRDNEFFKTGQLIFLPKRSTFLVFLMYKCFPRLSNLLKINFFDPKITEVFGKIMKDNVEYRIRNESLRNDFVDLLLKVKQNKSLDEDERGRLETDYTKHEESTKEDCNCLTLEEMTAQAFLFFAAGFETAASTTSFCLFELAQNPGVQGRLRREVDEVLAGHDGQITYQALQEMTYMDQVLNETLRRYASLPLLTRVCTEPYRLPGTDLVIEKGVRINIPVYAFHHDPDIYPDPFRFDPDRFSEENSKGRHPYAFMPFGEGPRMCIGTRFGRLQVKIGLAAILSRYQLSPAPDTPLHLEIHPVMVFTTAKHPFRLKISKRVENKGEET